MTTRVAVLASSPVLQAGLDALLAESGDVTLVPVPSAAVGDGIDATTDVAPLERAAGAGVDVVVWAPAAPGEVAAALSVGLAAGDRGAYGDTGPGALPALIVLADLAPRDAAAAVRAGARAVLPHGVQAATLAAAVAAVAAGLVVLPAADVTAVLPADLGAGEPGHADSEDGRSAPLGAGAGGPLGASLGPPLGTASAPPAGLAAHLPPLSARERDVLGLMAEGLANKQIAYRLGISEHTVKTHVAAVFTKLHAGTRAEAVVTAARAGLLLL